MLYVATIFLPLIGAIGAGFFGGWIGDRGAQLITCGLMGLSGLLSLVIFREVALDGNEQVIELFTWIRSGGFEASWALKFDTLTVVMVFVVSVVSALIHIYSIGYMAKDPSIPRFFSYLSLFTFFMLMLVTANNFVQLFFGWEGVGLSSYLLIGFWYDRASANAAAIVEASVSVAVEGGGAITSRRFAAGVDNCAVVDVATAELPFSAASIVETTVVGATEDSVGTASDSVATSSGENAAGGDEATELPETRRAIV